MSVKIGSARIDENGKAHGGAAGDQTGKEVSTQSWYAHTKGWVLLRAKSAEARENDRRMWLKIANRVGFESFLDALDQKSAEIQEDNQRGKRLRDPAAAFQKLLNKRFPKEGGAA